ncbi:MAG: energy-coupling factor transporter ATPase [Candidatus Thermoplasmatota archaeon]
MIRFDQVSFTYAGATSPALYDISIHISDGEFVLLTGVSGCGKSTLCRCLNGLVPHFYGGRIAGAVDVCGRNPFQVPPKEMAKVVGMVFQDPENQIVKTTVEQEIAFGLENQGIDPVLMVKRIEEVLDTIGIDHLRNRHIDSLSGGEKQKVALASVLVMHPKVVVLDEPTSELDPKGAEEVLQIVKRLNEEFGLTIVLVEHRLDRVVQCVDRVMIMQQGGIVYDGDPRGWVTRKDVLPMLCVPPVARVYQMLGEKKTTLQVPLTMKEARSVYAPFFINQVRTKQMHHVSHVLSQTQGTPVVDVHHVWFQYERGAVALQNVCFSLYPGEFVSILGRNASGKTTLAKLMMGLLKPSKGSVFVHGVDTKTCAVEDIAQHVGFVFQDPNMHLFADTVEEEIMFMMQNLGFSSEAMAESLENILHEFDLESCRTRYPRSLSTGEKQRVALASVLAARPQVLILDEPTRGLDGQLKETLMMHLRRYREQGGSVLLISHDVELIAQYGERVVLMSEGSIIADGDKHVVLANSLHFSPQINRLVQSFSSSGVPSDVLTADELLEVIR